jgi:hypothetical protein
MTPQCRHSEGRASLRAGTIVLWCSLHRTVPAKACASYVREPGADDEL